MVLKKKSNTHTLKINGKEQIQNSSALSSGCCSFMLHVYGCVFCSISLFCVYVCVCMPSSPRSIAGVPSGRALPRFPITAHHLCAFLLYLEG